MPLNVRQQHAYKHLVNLWKPVRSVNQATGKASAETYVLAYSKVPCLYQYTDNVSNPTQGVGRVKRMTIFTTDIIHFVQEQQIDEGWIVKNVSLLPDGTQSPLYGQFHRVLGVARVTPTAGARKANKRSVMCQVMEKTPPGVS